MPETTLTRGTVVPGVMYRNAPAAIDRLCKVFGFERHAVCAKSKAAGAEMIFDIADKPHGGRGFSCRDLEGHIANRLVSLDVFFDHRGDG